MNRYDKLQEYLINNQNTWLVTGAAGFIGSNLLEKLLILNQKVVGLDNFDTGYQHNIDQAIEDANKISGKDLKNNFKFIDGDIGKLDVCNEACYGVDYVLHQAALGSVPRSIKDPISTNRANIDGFLNMLVASKDANVKRFVYAASSSTYGDHPDLPKVEDKTGKPLSPYAVTKAVNELYKMIEDRLIERTEGLKKKEPIYRDYREGDVRHSQANIDKAKKLLGYDPKHLISKGMDEAIDWYINNLSKKT